MVLFGSVPRAIYWIVPLVVLACVIALFGRRVTDPRPARPNADQPVDFRLSADEYAREFRHNLRNAEAKYFGKFVELTGMVLDCGMEGEMEDPCLKLGAHSQSFGIVCFTVDQQPWAKVSRGQNVTIRGVPGKSDAFDKILRMFHTQIVAWDENPVVILTAHDLAAEFEADRQATNVKYGNKFLRVSGIVAGYDARDGSVHLRGVDDLDIKCNFGISDRLFDWGDIGKKYVVIGQYVVSQSQEVIELLFCLPIKEP